MVAVVAALLLLALDWHLYPESLPPAPAPHGLATNADGRSIASGAAFRRHSARAADYYNFRFHWPLAVLIGLAACGAGLALSRAALPRPTSSSDAADPAASGVFRASLRVLCGVIPALSAVLLFDAFAVECVPVQGPYMPDPACIWKVKPNMPGTPVPWVHTDALGFRGTPPVDNPQATVLIVGDSSSFGWKVDDDEKTYGWRLVELLGGRVAVANRALPGYSSWQGLQMLRATVDEVKPRVVVAAFMANDWTPGQVPDRALAGSSLEHQVRVLLYRSRLFLYLSSVFSGDGDAVGTGGGAPASPRVSPDDYRANLEEMRRICREHEAWLVVVALPMHKRLEQLSAPYRTALQAMKGEDGVTVVDLFGPTSDNPASQKWFDDEDPIHPDQEGHKFIARRLASEIAPHLDTPARSAMPVGP